MDIAIVITEAAAPVILKLFLVLESLCPAHLFLSPLQGREGPYLPEQNMDTKPLVGTYFHFTNLKNSSLLLTLLPSCLHVVSR